MNESNIPAIRTQKQSIAPNQPKAMVEQSMTEAEHQALRSHCADQITAAVDIALKAGKPLSDLAVVIFDIEDPATTDAALKWMLESGTGYTARVYQRKQVAEFLRNLQMPSKSAPVKWAADARTWVDANGKPATDFARANPYEHFARALKETPAEGLFWVVSFTKCTAVAAEVSFQQAGDLEISAAPPAETAEAQPTEG